VVVEAEVLVGGREADQHRGVDLGSEQGCVEDAGEVEPLVADPDPRARVDAVDAK
jgi:hypothetical protein